MTNSQNSLGKNKAEDITLTDFKILYKAIMVLTKTNTWTNIDNKVRNKSMHL